MGNEESSVVDQDTPPQTLQARSLEALAQYIKDGRAQKIVVMVLTLSMQLPKRPLTAGRQAQESALRPASQTSAPQRQDCTPTSHV
jgi:hypothetical protein